MAAMNSAPRVVVVTGASAGIGLAAAVQFAAQGDTVVATMRDPGRAGDLERAAGEAGIDLEILPLDVADQDSVDRAFEGIHERHGRVDVLVGNAGIGVLGTLEELPLERIRQAMEVNFYGVVRTTQAVLPRMREAGTGRLIAVSSLGGVMGQPFTDAYCAAKHAVEGLYESLQPVLARFGIRVSIVEPGPVGTRFHSNSIGFGRDGLGPAREAYEPLYERYDAVMAEGGDRKQSAEDAAAAIVAVASETDPHLRYQTHRFATKLAGMKLADLNGDAVTGFTSRWFDPPAN